MLNPFLMILYVGLGGLSFALLAQYISSAND